MGINPDLFPLFPRIPGGAGEAERELLLPRAALGGIPGGSGREPEIPEFSGDGIQVWVKKRFKKAFSNPKPPRFWESLGLIWEFSVFSSEF